MIKRLDETVVQRIAAGEILQRPANALKELLENAIDAGATQVTVSLQEGGLKSLQIVDNGHGIWRADAALLCERYATSKLSRFEELWEMRTFGFRGEALSSISQVSQLSVVSRRVEEPLGWTAEYREGRLAAEDPRPMAAQVGTTLTIRNLFYNLPLRRQALRPAEEQQRCLEVVQRYALEFAGRLSLQLRRADKVDVNLPPGVSRKTAAKLLWGVEGLTEIAIEDAGVGGGGLLSPVHASHRANAATFILFINGRLVEHGRLRRLVQQEYARVLPRGSHGWVFLSLAVPLAAVDVNVHPTKEEVVLLHEEAVLAAVMKQIRMAMSAETMNLSRPLPVPLAATPTRQDQAVSSSPAAPFQLLHSSPSTQTLGMSMMRAKRLKLQATPDEMQGSPSSLNSPGDLDSVERIKAEWRRKGDPSLTEMMAKSVWVGMVDEGRVLLQWETRLLLVQWRPLFVELIAQRLLLAFGQLQPKQQYTATVANSLLERAALLCEYFGMRVEEYCLTLPEILVGCEYDVDGLIDKLSLVSWGEEEACFRGVMAALTASLRPKVLSPEWLATVWHPAIRGIDGMPAAAVVFTEASCVLQLATTQQLYRVFERC